MPAWWEDGRQGRLCAIGFNRQIGGIARMNKIACQRGADIFGGNVGRRAGHDRGARRMGTDPVGYSVGLAVDDAHAAVIDPKGVGVVVEAAHQCMTTRGVHKPGVTMVTSRMLGLFRSSSTTRREFLALIGQSPHLQENA